MISYVKGILTETFEDTIVVEANGIGYNIKVPMTLFSAMPQTGAQVKIYTYLNVREDAMNLFGFANRDDLNIFKLLITVSGIGPKGALGILSTITPDDLRLAVLSDDAKAISKAPGIGAKTAKKLIIELKDKLKLEDAFEKLSQPDTVLTDGSTNEDGRAEAIQALVALGYGNSEAIQAVRKVENADNKDSETVLKEALKNLTLL